MSANQIVQNFLSAENFLQCKWALTVYPQSGSSTAIDYKVKFIYMLSKKYKLK